VCRARPAKDWPQKMPSMYMELEIEARGSARPT
jgi:hypothetical protein